MKSASIKGWHRDLRLKLWIIGLCFGSAIVLMTYQGLGLDFLSVLKPVGIGIVLLPFAIAFRRQGPAQLGNLLVNLLCMLFYSILLTVLTYAVTPFAFPLADAELVRVDRWLNISLPEIVDWTRANRLLDTIFNRAYFSAMPSTLLAIFVLGFDPREERLQKFVLGFMLAGLLTLGVFVVLPAEGPFAFYGYEMQSGQQRFIEQFRSLRGGEFEVVSLNHLEGLITFPSFHTAWAVLLAWSFRYYRWWCVPMTLVNIAMIGSTMTTGWHYAVDVLGGLFVAFLTILLSHWLVIATPLDEPESDPATDEHSVEQTGAIDPD